MEQPSQETGESLETVIDGLIARYGKDHVEGLLQQRLTEPEAVPVQSELAEDLPSQEAEDLAELGRQRRLAALKSIRLSSHLMGFSEIAPPKYEREGDKSSDVMLDIDTFAYGRFTLRFPSEGKRIVVEAQPYRENDMVVADPLRKGLIQNLAWFRDILEEEGVEAKIELGGKDQGREYVFPETIRRVPLQKALDEPVPTGMPVDEKRHHSRLAALKDLRQASHDLGFREQEDPRYADANDRNSDIFFMVDTFSHGKLSLTVPSEGNCVVINVHSMGDRGIDKEWKKYLNTVIYPFKRALEARSSIKKVVVSDGTYQYILPSLPPEPEERRDDDPPREMEAKAYRME